MNHCLVDTSVWITHFRHPAKELIEHLEHRLVLTHSAVIGELACGSIPKRKIFLQDLLLLPRCQEASFEEVLQLIDQHHLFGIGLSWVDMQLLASALLSNAILLTHDKKLKDSFLRLKRYC